MTTPIDAAATIAENVGSSHRVRENITDHYVGCTCGQGLSHLSHAAHVAHETVAELAAANLLVLGEPSAPPAPDEVGAAYMLGYSAAKNETAEDTRRHLITEPYDGHPDTETCPDCPHKPAEDTHTDADHIAADHLLGDVLDNTKPWSCSCGQSFRTNRQWNVHIVEAALTARTAPTTTVKPTEAEIRADEREQIAVVLEAVYGRGLEGRRIVGFVRAAAHREEAGR